MNNISQNSKKVNKYQSNVEDYLNKLRVPSDSVYTHISMSENYKGKFNLDKHQIKEFTKIYAEAVDNGAILSIGEKPKDYGPLLIDIDMDMQQKDCNGERLYYYSGQRLYNNDMIYEIIDAYRTASTDYLNLSNEELAVSLFEKPKPCTKKDKIKDGFHLIFQGIVAHYKLRYLIREKVVKLLSDSPTFKNYCLDKLIDKQVVHTNCWLLPGSKKPDGQLYQLKCIYDQNNQTIDIKTILSNKNKMINLFSLQHKIRSVKNQTEYLENISFELIEQEFLKLGDRSTKKVELNNNVIKSNDDINKAIETCLLCLPIDDYNDFEKWRDIALIINNELGYNGLDVLQKWSSDAKDYDKSKVEQFYKNIKPKENGLKIGTLKKKAKETNPDLYKSLFKKQKEQKEVKEIINTEDFLTQSTINYNKIKVEFEKNNFKILNPIMFATTTNNNNELVIRTKKDFKDVYENLQYLKWNEFHSRMMDSSFIDDWLKDETMRTYDKMDFLPMQQAPNNIYNTFHGYAAEEKHIKKDNIDDSLLIKHIKNLCNNDEAVYKYVIHFLARKLQKPNILTNTALIFKSNEGAGKDLFFNWFGNKILGSEYYYNTEKPELLFGKFTSSLENKILIIVNETSGKDTFSINENIKCAITAETNIIEHKGLKPYKNTNHIGFIFLTNNENPIKVPIDDRRFCGIECNNLICNNVDYFTGLRAELNNGEYDKAFYNFLMSIDCDNYDFTNNRPKTSFYNDIQELNKPALINFIEHFLIENYNKTNIEISSSQFYTKFNDYITKYNFKCTISLTKFVMDVKKIDGTDQKKTRTGRFIVFDVNQVKLFLKNKYNIEFSNVEDDNNDSDDDETENPLNI
jgi:hypothetical protein